MVDTGENVSEGMSNLLGAYADSQPVLKYCNRGQAGTIECTVVQITGLKKPPVKFQNASLPPSKIGQKYLKKPNN